MLSRLRPCSRAPRVLAAYYNQSTVQSVQGVIDNLKKVDVGQPEFMQAVHEVAASLEPVFQKDPRFLGIFDRICVPERVVMFRVPWVDDNGNVHVQRGYRVQFNSAIGPYKGGLRFHPTVNLGVIKFLGFEQIFKNALTTLPMGGGKGGSDFDPKGKSDREVMTFCQSFMTELQRHIGPDTDVPAGDIGVGGREVGYMFGQYKKVRNEFAAVLTGRDIRWGGSLIRPEATGYGTVYFADNHLQWAGKSLEGMRCTISGSGNVAQYTAEKLLDLGAVPITFSDSTGYVVEPNGFNREQLAQVMNLKNVQRKRISEYTSLSKTAKFVEGKRPWEVPCDIAFPSATQNEIEIADAEALVKNGCFGVYEGANMPSTPDAIAHYYANGVLYGPAKAANAGGVAVSGLEMSQGHQHLAWTREEVDAKLQGIMRDIFVQCDEASQSYGMKGNMQAGANIAGFLKVAVSMEQQGVV